MPDAPAPERISVRLVVDGRVQGVGFRYHIYDYAQEKGLTGWVRNLHTGQVETLAEGTRPQLDEFVEHVRRGPLRAVVTDIKIDWGQSSGQYERFMLLPTD